ncbi:MAG: hypothetical protein ACK5D9_00630, partial [Burkholderiales bacterium]
MSTLAANIAGRAAARLSVQALALLFCPQKTCPSAIAGKMLIVNTTLTTSESAKMRLVFPL